jgi:hypothetical protein
MMSWMESCTPLHGVVWIASHQCPAIILGRHMQQHRVSCLLISSAGFELKNVCNFDSTDVIDAAPMLALFESKARCCNQDKTYLVLSIAVALLNVAISIRETCSTSKKVFPWEILVADLCLRLPCIDHTLTSHDAIYNEVHVKVSQVCAEGDLAGYMQINAPPLRSLVTRRVQSKLQNLGENDASEPDLQQFCVVRFAENS